MRIVFMGTPAFAADILQGLIESHHEVVGCFTRPDAVRGRGKKIWFILRLRSEPFKLGFPYMNSRL